MSLSLEDRIKHWLPSRLYYGRKIRLESHRGEPELAMLAQLLPNREGMAIDVGCNRGLYSYVLSGLCSRVLAFEPNPQLAGFARSKLPANVDLRTVALASAKGTAVLRVPIGRRGREDHLKATIAAASSDDEARTVTVEVSTLDSFETSDVRLIKIDVEGTELDVLAGGAGTVARDRPVLIVELLVGNHGDAMGAIDTICGTYGYDAFVATRDGLRPARTVIAEGGQLPTRNVVFTPST